MCNVKLLYEISNFMYSTKLEMCNISRVHADMNVLTEHVWLTRTTTIFYMSESLLYFIPSYLHAGIQNYNLPTTGR